jgi:hypothetical protein
VELTLRFEWLTIVIWPTFGQVALITPFRALTMSLDELLLAVEMAKRGSTGTASHGRRLK